MSPRSTGSETHFTDYLYMGVSTPIYVNHLGRFGAKWHDVWMERKSLEDLKGAIREKIRQQGNVEILATRIDEDHYGEEPPEYTDVVIIGTTTRGGAAFYDADDESKTLSQFHRQGTFYRRLTPEERTAFTQLVEQRQRLSKEIEDFKEAREIDVEDEVGKIMQAKKDQGGEPT